MALSENGSSASSFASAAPPPTFLQRLAQRRQQLGVWALGASCFFLSLRVWEQQRELDRLKARVVETVTSLREENAKLKETLKGVREVLLSGEEAGEAGQSPSLTRLQIALGDGCLEGESSQVQNKAKKFSVL